MLPLENSEDVVRNEVEINRLRIGVVYSNRSWSSVDEEGDAVADAVFVAAVCGPSELERACRAVVSLRAICPRNGGRGATLTTISICPEALDVDLMGNAAWSSPGGMRKDLLGSIDLPPAAKVLMQSLTEEAGVSNMVAANTLVRGAITAVYRPKIEETLRGLRAAVIHAANQQEGDNDGR